MTDGLRCSCHFSVFHPLLSSSWSLSWIKLKSFNYFMSLPISTTHNCCQLVCLIPTCHFSLPSVLLDVLFLFSSYFFSPLLVSLSRSPCFSHFPPLFNSYVCLSPIFPFYPPSLSSSSSLPQSPCLNFLSHPLLHYTCLLLSISSLLSYYSSYECLLMQGYH